MRNSLVVAGLMLTAAVVTAARADNFAGAPVDTIVVTADRTPQPLDRVGSAVTVVDRRQYR